MLLHGGFKEEPIRDLHHFHESLERHKAGDAVRVTLWRRGETVTVRAVLEDWP